MNDRINRCRDASLVLLRSAQAKLGVGLGSYVMCRGFSTINGREPK